MAQQGSGFWDKARKAQQQLVRQFLAHPDVNMIDIGYLDEGGTKEQVALRIHVRDRWFEAEPQERIAFPEQVDDIPVAIVRGEYRTGE